MGALAFRDSFGGVEFRTPRPPSVGTVLLHFCYDTIYLFT